ncbi:hypothetical protein Zmor_009486 [Zophobas morio]|uniref:Insulin-like domain-containing protein n=1 Tax=Zophobas morio TaxID=2755281 RepID=A0AA38IL59_9CUCU|nr:hypothetical protein Zmor_009486 [Zophobas morio]
MRSNGCIYVTLTLAFLQMDLQYVFMVVTTVLATIHSVKTDEMSTLNNSDSKKIYCGKNLSQTLSAVCKGNYNTLNKKSDIENRGRAVESQRGQDFPFRNRAIASSLITNFRPRRRRGVFNECCEKPCSYKELSSYCGSNRKR